MGFTPKVASRMPLGVGLEDCVVKVPDIPSLVVALKDSELVIEVPENPLCVVELKVSEFLVEDPENPSYVVIGDSPLELTELSTVEVSLL